MKRVVTYSDFHKYMGGIGIKYSLYDNDRTIVIWTKDIAVFYEISSRLPISLRVVDEEYYHEHIEEFI